MKTYNFSNYHIFSFLLPITNLGFLLDIFSFLLLITTHVRYHEGTHLIGKYTELDGVEH